MKKEISEELLVKWVDNALTQDEANEMKAHLQEDSSLAAELAEMRKVSDRVRREVPASVEPPYPDFFNSQLMRKVDLDQASQMPKEKAKRWWRGFFQWAWAPAGAMALVLAFLAGQRLGPEGADPGALTQQRADLPTVYFSEDSLDAEMISDANGDLSAIVVNGLEAISDDASFVKTLPAGEELPVSYQHSEAKRFH